MYHPNESGTLINSFCEMWNTLQNTNQIKYVSIRFMKKLNKIKNYC